MLHGAELAESLRASLVGKLPLPQAVQVDEIQVEIGFSPVMRDYIDELYIQYEIHFGASKVPFSLEELELYAKCLVQQRVLQVRGEKTVIRPYDGHAIPAMLSVILEMMGRAEDSTTGIILMPKLSADLAAVKCDADVMHKLSMRLKATSRLGFVLGSGLPKPREGDFDFMSFAVIEGAVRHMRDDKPEAFAVAAAMLSLTGLNTFFGHVVYRVEYAKVAELKFRARELALNRDVHSKA